MLAFKKLDERPGYRLEVGMVTQTSTSLDTVTTPCVVLSRKLTTVCGVDVLDCRTVMTACDAFIGGKAYWSFRSAVAWVGRSVKVRGDVTNAGKLCTPVKSMLAELD